MRSFKIDDIYGLKQARMLTQFRNAVPLVWGSLRLTPITFLPSPFSPLFSPPSPFSSPSLLPSPFFYSLLPLLQMESH